MTTQTCTSTAERLRSRRNRSRRVDQFTQIPASAARTCGADGRDTLVTRNMMCNMTGAIARERIARNSCACRGSVGASDAETRTAEEHNTRSLTDAPTQTSSCMLRGEPWVATYATAALSPGNAPLNGTKQMHAQHATNTRHPAVRKQH